MSYFIGWIDKGGTSHGGYPGSSFWSPRVFGDFCGFRFIPAGFSDVKPATVPI